MAKRGNIGEGVLRVFKRGEWRKKALGPENPMGTPKVFTAANTFIPGGHRGGDLCFATPIVGARQI